VEWGRAQGHAARTGRPQPTQSSNTVPSLFILPFGVPASLGGEPGLEPWSVLCDALAVMVALGRVGVCTRCGHWRTREKEDNRRVPVRHSRQFRNPSRRKMKHQPYLGYNYARYISTIHNCAQPFREKRTVCGRCRIFFCSALPPGVTAMRHRP